MRRSFVYLLFALLVGLAVPAFGATELDDAQRQAVAKWLTQPASERTDPGELGLPTDLSRQASDAMREALWGLYTQAHHDEDLIPLPQTVAELKQQAEEGRLRLAGGVLKLGELQMPYAVVNRTEPEGDREFATQPPLFICMHGGGAKGDVQGPHAWAVNTREWQTQVQFALQLYQPAGIYFVPRMADDRLGRWWHAHNHDAFERVIEHAIAHWGVDPNRVYLLGISEGGFGTDILAPFMADRFAGANAMASGVALTNPPRNLRNLAFRTDVGENDKTFNRVGLAKLFHEELDKLHAQSPDAYTHSINVQSGKGHGIDYKPGVAWIAEHTRNPWPAQLSWLGKPLHERRRDRHYWVQIVGDLDPTLDVSIAAKADRETNTFTIDAQQLKTQGDEGNPTHANAGTVLESAPLKGVGLRVLLHDELLDLDRPITIVINGEKAFEGIAKRDAAAQLRTMAGYGDPAMTAAATIELRL